MNEPFGGLDTRAKGRLGEDEAEKFLLTEGYRIIERNFVSKAGEIDVIAEQAGDLCFIEIKARASKEFGGAIEAVGPSKRRRIARAASIYLALHPQDRPCRFDVVAMDLEAGRWHFTLVQGAFEVS